MTAAVVPSPLSTEVPQPISGVSPASVRETTIMTVWPSNAFFSMGRTLGQLYEISFPGIYFFRLGNLIALASIPIALGLYFARILPAVPLLGFAGGIRYRLTNRRVLVERGLSKVSLEKSVDLDRFDNIVIEVQPGQAWYCAGDLIFKLGNTETFRLEGVSRPEAFRSTCIKANMGCVGVQKIMAKKG